MKNEIEELMMLTPKRKSILWRYKSDEDESIFVYGISKGRPKVVQALIGSLGLRENPYRT